MLSPYGDWPYIPKVSYLLGGIEFYDREETLGEELWRFDPNNIADRDFLIRNYILKLSPYHTYQHKYMLLQALQDALEDDNYDFASLFDTDFDDPDDAHSSIAWGSTEIDNPRNFFEDVYKIATEVWSDDLKKAASEDRNKW